MNKNFDIKETEKLKEFSDNIAEKILDKEIENKLEDKLNNIANERKIKFKNMLELEDLKYNIERDIKYLKKLLKTDVNGINIEEEKDIIKNINISYNLNENLDNIKRKNISNIIIRLENIEKNITKEYKKIIKELMKNLDTGFNNDNNFNEYFSSIGPFISSDERFEYSDLKTKISSMLYTLIFLNNNPKTFIDTSFEKNLNYIKDKLEKNFVAEYVIANLDNEYNNEGVTDYISEIRNLQETVENVLFNFKILKKFNELVKSNVKIPIIFSNENITELKKELNKVVKNNLKNKELDKLLKQIEMKTKELKNIFVKSAKWDENYEYSDIVLKAKPDFLKGKKLLNEIFNDIEKSFDLIKEESIEVLNEIKKDFPLLEKLEEKIKQEQGLKSNYNIELH